MKLDSGTAECGWIVDFSAVVTYHSTRAIGRVTHVNVISYDLYDGVDTVE